MPQFCVDGTSWLIILLQLFLFVIQIALQTHQIKPHKILSSIEDFFSIPFCRDGVQIHRNVGLKFIQTMKQSWCLNIDSHCSAFPLQLRPSKDETTK